MKILYSLLFICFTTIASAQEVPKILWERTFGGRGSDITHDVLQTTGGSYVLVGETASNRFGDKDGLFIILNNQGESLVHELIGGEKSDEVIKAIVQLVDGNFMIAGYKETKAGRNGWMAKVDNYGEMLWEKEYGQSDKNEFWDIIQTKDGGLALTGITVINKNEDAWLLLTDKDGNLTWERSYGAGKPDFATTVVQTKDGGFGLAGSTDSKGSGKTDMWLVKITPSGALEWDKTFGTNRWEGCNDMVMTDKGEFVMVGYNSSDKMNMWVVKADAIGNELWNKEYGGSDMDEGKVITQTYDGGYAIVGNTRSHRTGSRYTKIWLHKLDAKGNSQYEGAYYGDNRNDEAEKIIQSSSGNYLIVGSTTSDGLGGKDFWVLELESGEKIIEKRPATISTSLVKLSEGKNDNDILDAGEQVFLEILIKNEGQVDGFDIKGIIQTSKKIKGLALPTTISVGNLPKGKSKQVMIPVSGSNRLLTDDLEVIIKFTDANSSDIPLINYTLHTEETPKAKIVITGDELTTKEDKLYVGTGATLKIDIANQGKKADNNIRVDFKPSEGVTMNRINSVQLLDIAPGGQKEVSFDFSISEDYKFQSASIICIITKGTGDTINYSIKVPIDKRPEPAVVAQPTIIRWYAPDIDFYRDEPYKLRNEKLFVKIKIESPKEYKRGDFQMMVDGKPYKAGSKFDEGSLRPNGKNKRNLYVFTYQDTVAFENEGIHEVMLQVKGDEDVISEPLKVAFSKAKPNLYLVAVGTKTNLEYTVQDAKDFAELYRSQEGKLFNTVEVKSLLAEKATARNIIESIEKVNIKYQTNNLTSNDMVIVFMSSHGFMLGGEFYLQGDDYQTGLHRTRAVQFSEVTEILDAIPCKKLIFIDACHSGGAKGVSTANINEAIKQLNSVKEGTTTIVSSSKDELSYEDKAWENGAFTESIMKGLRDGKADADKNKVVSIDELFGFLRKEVPSLVKEIKGQPQTPQIVNKGLGNVGIFVF